MLQLLRIPKVDELDVTVGAHHDVLWLKVAVHYMVRVQVAEGHGDARRVEGRVSLGQDGVTLRGEGLGVSS